jgi:hypothetical protein
MDPASTVRQTSRSPLRRSICFTAAVCIALPVGVALINLVFSRDGWYRILLDPEFWISAVVMSLVYVLPGSYLSRRLSRTPRSALTVVYGAAVLLFLILVVVPKLRDLV